MKVLIAPDKFKGTLTASEAAQAIARGWGQARPQDELNLLPISDGGDGFGSVMSELLGARAQRTLTVDAAHRRSVALWWWEPRSKTAIIETARIIGLAMLPKGKFHPFDLDTFGVGKVLRAAQRKGARQIVMGIGGSATNDGGFGFARALGWRFVDAEGNELNRWTDLHRFARIQSPREPVRGKLTVAVDVQNKLLGLRGATRIYGPQKGIRPEDVAVAEANLRRLASVMKQTSRRDLARVNGTGAAGGLGFGLLAFAGAELAPGFDLFARRAGLLRRVRAADLVLTGEGAIDDSTVMGKGVGELARACRKLKIPCVGLAGHAKQTVAVKKLFRQVKGLTDIVPVADALRHPEKHLDRLAERVSAKWREQKLARD